MDTTWEAWIRRSNGITEPLMNDRGQPFVSADRKAVEAAARAATDSPIVAEAFLVERRVAESYRGAGAQ